jgi:hypothetical protein
VPSGRLPGPSRRSALSTSARRLVAGGRELAAGIPNARLVVLESDNHGIPPSDPAYPQFLEAIDAFLAEDPELSEATAGG